MRITLTIIICFLISMQVNSYSQSVIDVNIQGISDGTRDSKQKDRDEAIMDAELKAIEKAGVYIKSVTEIEDFILKKDLINSKAEAFILPGFNIIDIGYGEDGLYHIVLIGKVRCIQPDIINIPKTESNNLNLNKVNNLIDIDLVIKNDIIQEGLFAIIEGGFNYLSIDIDDKNIFNHGKFLNFRRGDTFNDNDILNFNNLNKINVELDEGWHKINVNYQLVSGTKPDGYRSSYNTYKYHDSRNCEGNRHIRKFKIINTNKIQLIVSIKIQSTTWKPCRYGYDLLGAQEVTDYIQE